MERFFAVGGYQLDVLQTGVDILHPQTRQQAGGGGAKYVHLDGGTVELLLGAAHHHAALRHQHIDERPLLLQPNLLVPDHFDPGGELVGSPAQFGELAFCFLQVIAGLRPSRDRRQQEKDYQGGAQPSSHDTSSARSPCRVTRPSMASLRRWAATDRAATGRRAGSTSRYTASTSWSISPAPSARALRISFSRWRR